MTDEKYREIVYPKGTPPKICVASNDLCAFIAGSLDLLVITNDVPCFAVSLGQCLVQICDALAKTNMPSGMKVERLYSEFSGFYTNAFVPVATALGQQYMDTQLTVLSFDSKGTNVLHTSFMLRGTNFPLVNTAPLPGVRCHTSKGFIPSLLRGDVTNSTMLALRDNPCVQTLIRLDQEKEKDLLEQRIVECILELFRLHKEYAKALGFEGTIDGPYVIYRLQRGKIARVH